MIYHLVGIIDSVTERGRELASFEPGAWTALAAWVAIIVVVIALIYAWRQYLKARERQAELTQPNVSMFMEPSSADWHLVELVVRNYGQRPAYGLRFEFANRRRSASTKAPTTTTSSTSCR
ncbi:hypothetical protein BN970_01487 [Mycolicibacterium conceptionense]|uniref:Transmembrane protein n=1 Tax=Mycolicibacterium conceptionense TaxID=451644 RepID=A0A0U1D5S5_9MYCO|nr:hypothetical protein BN970_01487 [Mycolicibacterium conceptionense]